MRQATYDPASTVTIRWLYLEYVLLLYTNTIGDEKSFTFGTFDRLLGFFST